VLARPITDGRTISNADGRPWLATPHLSIRQRSVIE
jgi:hypothetical protein